MPLSHLILVGCKKKLFLNPTHRPLPKTSSHVCVDVIIESQVLPGPKYYQKSSHSQGENLNYIANFHGAKMIFFVRWVNYYKNINEFII